MKTGAQTASAATFAWMRQAPLARIAAALDAREKAASRYVGGCVRDSLVGVAPADFDIATSLAPQDVVAALEAAGLRWAPTGLEHGTVTAIADGAAVEITTLRADVSTDGRRATVAFTQDWALDAMRRDFRLNAIYLSFDGAIFDPVNGAADAQSGRVRFIGDPEDRIREDYLRILRFFRFSARFSGGFDAAGLAACAAHRSGLSALSAERIGDEVFRILDLPRAAMAVDAMAAAGVLDAVWSAPADRYAFSLLKEAAPDAPAPLGLAALFGRAGGEGVDAALRRSNAEAARRKTALDAADALIGARSDQDARRALYAFGAAAFADGALVGASVARRSLEPFASLPSRWSPPRFPFSGKDVVARGIAAGPAVARVLKATESAWIAEDFPPIERLVALLDDQVARA